MLGLLLAFPAAHGLAKGKDKEKDKSKTSTPVAFKRDWTAKPVEEASGLTFYGFRYYSPELGRWTCRDPKEERGGLNLYTTVENGTTNRVDVLGLDGWGPMPVPPGYNPMTGEPNNQEPEDEKTPYDRCMNRCFSETGGIDALALLGASTVAGGTVPKPFGAGWLAGASPYTTVPSLIEFGLGWPLRELGRKLNPVMTGVQYFSAGYAIGTGVTCAAGCAMFADESHFPAQ